VEEGGNQIGRQRRRMERDGTHGAPPNRTPLPPSLGARSSLGKGEFGFRRDSSGSAVSPPRPSPKGEGAGERPSSIGKGVRSLTVSPPFREGSEVGRPLWEGGGGCSSSAKISWAASSRS